MNGIPVLGKRGAWINHLVVPTREQIRARMSGLDYVVVKSFLTDTMIDLEDLGIPFLVETFAVEDVDPEMQGSALKSVARSLGCMGAVLNVEYWNDDLDGSKTAILCRSAASEKPIYACIDARRQHLNFNYQRVLATLCDGVMPMCYPAAFQQSPEQAVTAVLNPDFGVLWAGKPVVPVIQAYGNVGADQVARTVTAFSTQGLVNLSAYTLGHATDTEWAAFIRTNMPDDNNPDIAKALLALRVKWYEVMLQLAAHGNADELASFAAYWKGMIANAATANAAPK